MQLDNADLVWLKNVGVNVAQLKYKKPAPPPPFYLRPHLWDAWIIFNKMSTQWKDGMGGRTGLDGAVLQGYLKEVYPGKKNRKKRLKRFDKIILISHGALDAWADQREADKNS